MQLADRLDDEALHLGAETATPALLALELARVLAKSNASFRGSIAPVLDALSAMTLAARNALAAARESEGEARDGAEGGGGVAHRGARAAAGWHGRVRRGDARPGA